MKYFKKFLIVGVLALFGVSFCNAGAIKFSILTTQTLNGSATGHLENSYSGYMCLVPIPTASSNLRIYNTEQDLTDNTNYLTGVRYGLYCRTGTIYLKNNSTASITYNLYNLTSITTGFNSSCPTCPSQYTSLECQTEYSLIPVSDVTENYCTANFDLISPSDCPVSSGTGDTQRSALYVNNVQYAGASNIYLNVSDFLDYSTTYIESGSSFVLDVDGYVADTGYLNDILTVQEFHPDNGDFVMSFVGGLTLLLPYLVVVLFVMFIWKLIRKIFKF